MKTKAMRAALIVMIIMIGIIIGCFCYSLTAYAATGDRMVVKSGHIYIYNSKGKPRTGWITYKGKRYYAHKTTSRKYPKGSVTVDQCRVKNGKMYYMDSNGRKVTKNTKSGGCFYEMCGRGPSIRYIYRTRGARRGATRYNCINHHLQYLNSKNKWVNDGWGYWWDGIDWQE